MMLLICILFLTLSYAAAYACIFFYCSLPLSVLYCLAGVCLLGFAALIYLLVRLMLFRRKLTSFFRLALSGNYKPGVIESARTKDELAHLERLVNKFAQQLQEYDALRASRVALVSRVIDFINRSIRQPVIIADMSVRSFQFNPAAQKLFGFEQETLSFDSIRSQKNNAQFMALFESAVFKEKLPKVGRVILEIPIRNITKEIGVKIMPFKDKDEEVKLAVILAAPVQPTESEK